MNIRIVSQDELLAADHEVINTKKTCGVQIITNCERNIDGTYLPKQKQKTKLKDLDWTCPFDVSVIITIHKKIENTRNEIS